MGQTPWLIRLCQSTQKVMNFVILDIRYPHTKRSEKELYLKKQIDPFQAFTEIKMIENS